MNSRRSLEGSHGTSISCAKPCYNGGFLLATPQTKQTRRMLPGLIDIAYEQYKRNLPLYRLTEDLMTRQVITISPEASLDEAGHIMGQKHVGSLIVEKYKTAIGIVTERDLLSKVIAYGILLGDQKVEDAMSYPLTGVSVQTDIKTVAKMMTTHKGRIPVYRRRHTRRHNNLCRFNQKFTRRSRNRSAHQRLYDQKNSHSGRGSLSYECGKNDGASTHRKRHNHTRRHAFWHLYRTRFTHELFSNGQRPLYRRRTELFKATNLCFIRH